MREMSAEPICGPYAMRDILSEEVLEINDADEQTTKDITASSSERNNATPVKLPFVSMLNDLHSDLLEKVRGDLS